MSNEILNSILREYSKKKINAELELEQRKNNLYKSIPRLSEIEDQLNSYALQRAKSILLKNSNSLDKVQEQIDKLKKEKLELLNKHNISLDYLEPSYSCTFCKDTGYIYHTNKQTEMCNCLKQKLLNISYDNSNISNIKNENFSTFNDKLFSDKADSGKYKLNISPRKNINNIKNNCIKFINDFDNPDSKNLLFTGNTGLRKNIYVQLYCL